MRIPILIIALAAMSIPDCNVAITYNIVSGAARKKHDCYEYDLL